MFLDRPQAGRRTQAERRQATRSAIIDSARDRFSEKGFAAASLEEIVGVAGVTRGALYHHFRDKADLYRAVVEQIDEDLVAEAVALSSGTDDPVEWVRRAARAYIEVCSRLRVTRIGAELQSVLGPEEYRRISQARCLPIAVVAGRAASEAGVEIPGDAEVMAALIIAALDEGVRHYTEATTPVNRRRVLETVDGLITGVLGLR